jgi:hypothetical protein
MKRKIIAFIGPIGVGKSTAAEMFAPYQSVRISFATPLKEMLMSMGLTSEDVWGSDKEKPNHLLGGCTPRHAMQTLGTEWGRNLIHPDLWVNAWSRKVEQEINRHIVVDDMRFPNEYHAIKNLGGVIVRIVREDVGVRVSCNHESEAYDFSHDYIIHNPGGRKELFRPIVNKLALQILNA